MSRRLRSRRLVPVSPALVLPTRRCIARRCTWACRGLLVVVGSTLRRRMSEDDFDNSARQDAGLLVLTQVPSRGERQQVTHQLWLWALRRVRQGTRVEGR